MATVDKWSLVDNSDRVAVPVALGGDGAIDVFEDARWEELRALAEDG